MKIKKPIIVIGTGRSGSTIFNNVFSQDRQLSGITYFADKNPNNFRNHRIFFKLINIPYIGKIIEKRYPFTEGYKFWDYYSNGFSTPCRDLTLDDLTLRTKTKLLQGMEQLLSPLRNRLLLKITGWPRITFLKGIFPDAKFIHIIRDGRAVANSLVNVDFWWGWRGPSNWRWGELNEKYQAEWIKHNKSFIALAAIEWKIVLDALEIGKNSLDTNDFLEIKYENLCENPMNEFEKVFEYSELDFTSRFKQIINNTKFINTNTKWKKELTEKQKTILEDVLKDYLLKYDYI